MPMSTNGFKWRPNDNSSVTSHRYEIEAQKWVDAVDAAKSRNRRGLISKDLGSAGMILEGVVAFIALIGIGLYSGIKFCIKEITEIFEDHQTKKSLEKFQKERKQMKKRGASYTPSVPSIKERRHPPRLFFDGNGNAWFIWEFLLRTLIIFSVVFFTAAFLHLYMNPDFDLNDKYFLIYTGGVSIYFGFMGTE